MKSIGAILAGILTGVVLAIGTDMVLRATGIFPALGQPMAGGLFVLATAYRTLYGVAGSYITARLAPNRPMLHALVLGVLGLAVSIVGVVVTWDKGPNSGRNGTRSHLSPWECRKVGWAANSARCRCAPFRKSHVKPNARHHPFRRVAVRSNERNRGSGETSCRTSGTARVLRKKSAILRA